MSDTGIFLSVVVPCYNEEAVIEELYNRLSAVCAPYAESGYEILLIDDGSHDTTWQKIEALHKSDTHVSGIRFSRNFGHGMALTAGLDASRGKRIFIIDADLQDPPELLDDMMMKMNDGADVVYGQRIRREGESWFKRNTARYYYRLIDYLSDINLPKDTGDFRLINRRVLNALQSMPESARYVRGMVAWVGFKQVPIPYERKGRFAGATHYTLEKMIKLALDGLTGFSNRPLRMAFYLSLLMLMLSFLFFLYVMWSYIEHDTVRGWASLALLFTGSQALQWFMMGLLGEYIGRIYQESKQRPKYIIADQTTKIDE